MKRFRISLQDTVPFIAFLIIFVFFAVASNGNMLSAYTLRTILDQSMITILIGLGVLFAAAQGSIDLSVGVNLALSGVLATRVALATDLPWLMVPLALLFALIVGVIVGVIVSRFKVSSFMVTIAMLIGVRGLVNYIQTKIGVEYIPDAVRVLNLPNVKIPLFFAIVAIMLYLFEFTKAGRYSKAIGENEVTARFVGVPITKMKILAFALSGLMSGVGAVFTLVTVGGTTNTMGTFLEMKVAMAIFFGGVLVTGGASAKIYKVLLGSLSITIIINGLALIGKSESQISEMVEGLLLLLILFITILANYRDRRRVKTAPDET
ncbi:MAG: ABC transporter permease [Clostridiales Family XIII bacterium]|jgi:ribose transport system permease protein|nr:ABC transporter permease [Clostridiales Family XIII bacterium]